MCDRIRPASSRFSNYFSEEFQFFVDLSKPKALFSLSQPAPDIKNRIFRKSNNKKLLSKIA